MKSLSNITIQVMTFDDTLFSGELFTCVTCILKSDYMPKLVWCNQIGARKSISIRRLHSSLNNLLSASTNPTALGGSEVGSPSAAGFPIVFNEGYIPIPPIAIPAALVDLGCRSIESHISVSPTSQYWEKAPEFEVGKPFPIELSGNNNIRQAQGMEKAATRKNGHFPTVLEITLCFEQLQINNVEGVIQWIYNQLTTHFRRISVFGVVDFGDERLFFPKSGYNYYADSISAFALISSVQVWNESRNSHNASFSIDPYKINGACDAFMLHSMVPRL